MSHFRQLGNKKKLSEVGSSNTNEKRHDDFYISTDIRAGNPSVEEMKRAASKEAMVRNLTPCSASCSCHGSAAGTSSTEGSRGEE